MKINFNEEYICQDSVLVWDKKEHPPQGSWRTILWQGHNEENTHNTVSLLKIIEERDQVLRKKYLEWVYELGETKFKGDRLIDLLEIRPGFSYWWITPLTLKANVHISPRIVDAIKMLALDDILFQNKPKKLILVSSDQKLAHVIKHWCQKTSIYFEHKRSKKKYNVLFNKKSIFKLLPHTIQAILNLIRFIIRYYPLRNVGLSKVNASDAKLTFVSYLFNLNIDSIFNYNYFKTWFWTKLHDILNEYSIKSIWLHKYIPHNIILNSSNAKNLIKRLNNQSNNELFHCTILSALNINVIFNSLKDYIRLMVKAYYIRRFVKSSFQISDNRINLFPFFESDWDSSMYGPICIKNCLDLNLSENILRKIPAAQSLGFYLQENQAWERILVYSWKAAGHETLIGVIHSTLKFWDLRHFFDPRTYQRKGHNNLPMPDKVAINSPVAKSLYIDAGYPEEQIVEVEALRYLYLEDFMHCQTDANTTHSDMKLRVLVLGDYSPHATRRQMKLLHDAAHLFPENVTFLCKPHPACSIDPQNYPLLDLQMTTQKLKELLNDCSVAYTSNTTSAAVDAWCAGVPVISILGGESLNMSPLRGMEGVAYVSSSDELAETLRWFGKQEDVAHGIYGRLGNKNMKRSEAGVKDDIPSAHFFYLGKDLSRWKRLLQQYF